jgi:hypothetical protein
VRSPGSTDHADRFRISNRASSRGPAEDDPESFYRDDPESFYRDEPSRYRSAEAPPEHGDAGQERNRSERGPPPDRTIPRPNQPNAANRLGRSPSTDEVRVRDTQGARDDPRDLGKCNIRHRCSS